MVAIDEVASPICAQCDYSLIGLPPGAKCPECGTPIDCSIISLRGWGSTGLASVRPAGMAWILMLNLLIVGLWLIQRWKGSHPPSLFMAFVLILSAFQLFRRWSYVTDQDAPLRLRLSAKGFEQRLGPGPLNLTPWHKDVIFSTEIGKKREHRILINWRFSSLHLLEKPIDFHFNSESQPAQALRDQIALWAKAAGATVM
jgi:hypothetical protein